MIRRDRSRTPRDLQSSVDRLFELSAAKIHALDRAWTTAGAPVFTVDGRYTARGWMRSNFTWQWADAQADLERALAIDPSNSTVQRRYGQLLASQGRMADAIAAIRKSVALDPLSGPPWSNLGYYLLVAGQWDEARQVLQRALAITPESAYAQVNLAPLELLQGHADTALQLAPRRDALD